MSKREHNSMQSLLPEGYRQLEYLESTGSQYIDTGVIPSIGISVACDGVLVPQTRTGYGVDPSSYLFGTRYYLNGSYNQCTIGDGGSGDPFYSSFGNKPVNNGSDASLYNTRHLFFIDNETFSVDGIVKAGLDGCSFTSGYPSYPIYLFALADNYQKSNPPKPTGVAQMGTKIYSVFIYNNSDNARVFVPALRTSDNKPGLYDICGSICPLTGTPLYINAGTGEFLYA